WFLNVLDLTSGQGHACLQCSFIQSPYISSLPYHSTLKVLKVFEKLVLNNYGWVTIKILYLFYMESLNLLTVLFLIYLEPVFWHDDLNQKLMLFPSFPNL